MTVTPDWRELGTAFDESQDLSTVMLRTADGTANYDAVYGRPGVEPNAAQMQDMLGRDGQAAKIMEVLTLPLRSAQSSIVPGKGDTGEAALCESVLETAASAGGMTTPLPLVISQMTSAVAYRFAAFELNWTTEDVAEHPVPAPVSLASIAWRPTLNTKIERDRATGTLLGLKQWVPYLPGVAQPTRDAQGYVAIPANKALLYLHAQHRNPLAGSSDLRIAYRCWEISKRIMFLWTRYLSTRSLPYMVVVGADGQNLGKQLATLEQNGVAGINATPGEVDVTSLNLAGGGGDQFQTALNYLMSEASNSVLAGFTDLSSTQGSGRGSYALASSANDTFNRGRVAVQAEMAATLTDQLLAPICRFNRPGQPIVVPTWKFDSPTGLADLAAILPAVLELAQAYTAGAPVSLAKALGEKIASVAGVEPGSMVWRIAQAGNAAAAAGPAAQAGVNRLAGETTAAEKLAATQQSNNSPTQ